MVVLRKGTKSWLAEINPIKRIRFRDKTMVYASRKFMTTFRADGDVLSGLQRHTCGTPALQSRFRAFWYRVLL